MIRPEWIVADKKGCLFPNKVQYMVKLVSDIVVKIGCRGQDVAVVVTW